MHLGQSRRRPGKSNLVAAAWALAALATAFVSGCASQARKGEASSASTSGESKRGGHRKQTASPVRPSGRPSPGLDAHKVLRALSRLRNGAAPVRARVPTYEVRADLSNVVNAQDFAKELNRAERAGLARAGFVLKRTGFIQPYDLYEDNEYKRPHRYPPFLTVDALLHSYHQLFDKALEWLESELLAERLVRLSKAMYEASQKALASTHNEQVRQAALRLRDFFALSLALLGQRPPKPLPSRVARELGLIRAHRQTAAVSPILGTKLDYTMFLPRGHYTRSETLQRYFQAMVWFGTATLRLSPKYPEELTTALLVTALLNRPGSSAPIHDWAELYRVTSLFVGPTDDVNPHELWKLVTQVWPHRKNLEGLADPAKRKELLSLLGHLPRPRIRPFLLDTPRSQTQARVFKFMGMRYVLDSEILQRLVHPKVPNRFWPSGLDLAAAFGFERAARHVTSSIPKGARWTADSYRAALERVRAQVATIPPKQWQGNLYWSWLHVLGGLLADFGQGYPQFMQTDEWKDRQLLSFLGSWTELRHDTILYAKQSGAECGEDEDEPPLPKGYVEPNVEAWRRIEDLAARTRALLAKLPPWRRKTLLDERLAWLAEWAAFCRKISTKELSGQPVTQTEYEKMVVFGAEMEAIHQILVGGDLATLTPLQRHMGLVADIHRSGDQVLEEAIGSVAAIYVVVPSDGKLRIARGAAFSHYEFRHPAADRLTDNKWKERLKKGQAPALAPWLERLFPAARSTKPGFQFPSGGC